MAPRLVAITQTNRLTPHLPMFLAHHSQLVDHIFVGLHALEVEPPANSDKITWVNVTNKSYVHHLFMNFIANRFANEGDVVFPLDVDEFLNYEDRASLLRGLRFGPFQNHLKMHWKPVIPPRVGGLSDFHDFLSLQVHPGYSNTHKIVFKWRKGASYIARGNHYARRRLRERLFKFPMLANGIIHVPFLTFGDLRKKILENSEARFRNKISSGVPRLVEKYGTDWFLEELTPHEYATFALNYRERDQNSHIAPSEQMQGGGEFFLNSENGFELWSAVLKSLQPRRLSADPSEAERSFYDRVSKMQYIDPVVLEEMLDFNPEERTICFRI